MEILKELRRLLNEALTYNRKEEAKEMAQEGLRIAEQKELLGLMEYFRGEIALINEDYGVALEHFDRAVKFDPADGETYNDKAVCLAELGRQEEALICFDKGIEAAADYGPLYNNNGWLLIHMERYKEAIYWCEKSLEHDPNSPVVYANIAQAQEYLNDVDGAIKNLEHALSLLPEEDQESRDWILSRIEKLKSGDEENNL
jgi:tetratricopeptide (TPR) repeat protein